MLATEREHNKKAGGICRIRQGVCQLIMESHEDMVHIRGDGAIYISVQRRIRIFAGYLNVMPLIFRLL